MKKLIILLLLLSSLFTNAQFILGVGGGYAGYPIAKIDVGYKYRHHVAFIQYLPQLTNSATSPFVTGNINYGYTISNFQPYIGMGTKGFSYGLNVYFRNLQLTGGKYGNYIFGALSYQSIDYKPNNKMLSGNDWLIISLEALAGFADGLNQKIAHHHFGQGKQFWDYDVSWKNKYKDFDNGDTRAAYPGSKDIFVAFTDGYHLTRFIDRTANLATIAVSLNQKPSLKKILKKVIISALANRLAFYTIYNF
jgi:hypothetical protein